MTRPLDWSDLLYFLELARSCKLSLVAKKLEVEHTTVARRISRLEKELSVVLFDRRQDGYVLTEPGKDLLPYIEEMEASMLMALSERNMKADDPHGVVRIGVPEAFGQCVFAPELPQLYARYPNLRIELMPTHYFLNLATREADILVTLDPPHSGRYVLSRLTQLDYELHGSSEYLAKHPPIQSISDLASHFFVDYVQDRLMSKNLNYLERFGSNLERSFTCSSILVQRDATIFGMGLSMLTPYVVKTCDKLVRVLPSKTKVSLTLWLVAPKDLFRLRRVRACWDFLRELADKKPQLFVFRDS